MAKLLIPGSVVVAGLAIVAFWSEAPVVAFWAQPSAGPQVLQKARKEANKSPFAEPIQEKGTAQVEEDLRESGVIRTILVFRDAKTLRERYVGYHQGIADRLTVEQLAEKCNSLRRESIGLSPEGEIEQTLNQMDQLMRKHQDDKGLSTRIQAAMEAIKKPPAVESSSR